MEWHEREESCSLHHFGNTAPASQDPEYSRKSLPEEIRKGITYFPLPGRISGKDLTLWDKFLIAIGKIVEQDETLKKDMGKDFDGVQRENISPLFEYLENVEAILTSKK